MTNAQGGQSWNPELNELDGLNRLNGKCARTKGRQFTKPAGRITILQQSLVCEVAVEFGEHDSDGIDI